MTQDTDLVATLLRTAGHRVVPPRHVYEATLAVAQTALERKLRARMQRRIGLRFAAGLLLMIGIAALLIDVQREPPADAARVVRIVGAAERSTTDDSWLPFGDTVAIGAGTRLRTLERSGLGLTLRDGSSLRLAANTEIALVASDAVHLTIGKLYVDTGTDSADESTLRILTPVGTTRDLGTRFEVRFRDGQYRLRVRDGRVLLERDGKELRSSTGEELTLDPSGAVSRSRIAPHAAVWRWAEDLASPPSVDGEPLVVLLDWVARETGREIRYASPELEDRVRITVLHGHLAGLAPLDALAVMLATTNFEHVLRDDGTILIRPRNVSPRRP